MDEFARMQQGLNGGGRGSDKSNGPTLMVGHLLQHTLRCLCTTSGGHWVYSVFWRILPRNYPPPKWDSENNVLDRSKGNKRNWILVWEDGFCDFVACANSFSAKMSSDSNKEFDCAHEYMRPELFFKMSHEVYNFGEGLMGKVAADSSHKWVYKDPPDSDPHYSSSWQGALDPHPRTWEAQFKSGIETIAIVAVKEGLVQLGSLKKATTEDLNFVLFLQRKFNYLHSIPGVYALHPSALNMIQQQQQIQGTARKTSSTYNQYNNGMQSPSTAVVGVDGAVNSKTLMTIDQSHNANMAPPTCNVTATRDFFGNVVPQQYTTPIYPHMGPTFSIVPESLEDDEEEDEDFVDNMNSSVYMAEEVLDNSNGHHSSNIDEYRHVATAYNSLHALLSRLPSVVASTGTTSSPDSTTSSSTTFDSQYVPYFTHAFVQHTPL